MNRQTKRIIPFKPFSIAVIGIALALSMPALAQQKGSESGQDKSQPQSMKKQKHQDQQMQGQNVSQEMQLDPMGWVTVGYDFNDDGIYDAFERVSVYDLQQRKAQRQDIASAQPYTQQQNTQPDAGRAAASNRQQDQTQYQNNQQGQRQGQNVSKGMQFDREGWVTLGYDYNNDGTYDAFEIISVYDLQKRKGQQQDIASVQPYTPEQGGQPDAGQAAAADRQKHMVEGNIIKIQTVGVANSDRQHVIAKVDTERGTIANVDLGPKENLGQLNLQQGSHIKVFGVEGTIDKNGFLMADRLQVDGQRVAIDRKDYRPLKKYGATLLSTRTLGNEELKNTMARVELEDGLKTMVNLGPANDLPNLSEGQQIQFLARITEIKGQKALIADSLLINGKTYQIDWDKVQKRNQQASS